jgi:MYXO-CTERM domain-containing protein
MGNNHSVIRVRNAVALAVADVVLFVIANVTAKNSSHPGTVSNIAFVAFLVGLVLLIALGAAVLIRRRRAATRLA